ncbi:MAG: isocitrate lyase/phosphoenolpyruvate mutase family protein [Pseudomonadota bacterium]
MIDQTAKAKTFSRLHQDGCFIIPNPWDVGSAKLLEGMGFAALATTSAGFARSTGVEDYEVTRDQVLEHARNLCGATEIPVSADLENGFGHAPKDCFETISLAASVGLVGGSIEDFSGQAGQQYPIAQAKDRIAAAVEAADAQAFKFTLTARAENFFTGMPDLADTIARLQAYQDAGADVLYAPGLKTLKDIQSVLSEVDRPVNVLLGPQAGLRPVTELAALGVRRISLGSALANIAMDAIIKAGDELLSTGTFTFLAGLEDPGRMTDLMFGRKSAE